MTRIAAIDCGTNSIRLLIADVDVASGKLVDVERRLETVRLGQGVDRTGEFAADALVRTLAACRGYAQLIADHGCDRVRFVATSATRDARNREQFVAGVRDILGVEPEVVSGAEEAALSFRGATQELGGGQGGAQSDSFLVVDIGGGSTELVVGRGPDDQALAAVSVDVGCVRMTERHLLDDPPTPGQIRAAEEDIDAAVAEAVAAVAPGERALLVGLAGSVTTVAAMALDLPAYDPARIHHASISAAEVHEVTKRLLAMPRADREALPFMHPGRVDVIGAGALILSRVVVAVGATEVLVSEHDILDGIAFSAA